MKKGFTLIMYEKYTKEKDEKINFTSNAPYKVEDYEYYGKTVVVHSAGDTNQLYNDSKFLFVGGITNRQALLEIIACKTGNMSDEKIILGLYEIYGQDAFRMISGAFVCVFLSAAKLVIATGKTSGPSMYYKFDKAKKKLIVTTEIGAIPQSDRVMIPFRYLKESSMVNNRSATNLLDVNRVLPGHFIEVDITMELGGMLQCYYSPCKTIKIYDEAEAKFKIKEALTNAIDNIPDGDMISLISGGLDSSIITYLAKKRFKNLNLYTVGTENRNEFKEATVFANSIGEKVNTIIFEENEFIRSFCEVISLVGHSHSRFIEYLTPVNTTHKYFKQAEGRIVSGYGSDILFGGFAKPHMKVSDITRLVWSEYNSTYWSNETSQNLGDVYNLDIYYPYFDDRLVDLTFEIDPKLKFENNIEKYILRAAFSDDIVDEIVWRKKVGIHEGTGCESFFTQLVDTSKWGNTDIRENKDYLAYKLFESIFINHINIDNVDKEYINKLL